MNELVHLVMIGEFTRLTFPDEYYTQKYEMNLFSVNRGMSLNENGPFVILNEMFIHIHPNITPNIVRTILD